MKFLVIYCVQASSLLISLLSLRFIMESGEENVDISIYLNVIYLSSILAPIIDIEMSHSYITRWKRANFDERAILLQASWLYKVLSLFTLLILGLILSCLNLIDYGEFSLSALLTTSLLLVPTWRLLAEGKMYLYATAEMFPKVVALSYLMIFNDIHIYTFFVIQGLMFFAASIALYLAPSKEMNFSGITSDSISIIFNTIREQLPLIVSRLCSAFSHYLILQMLVKSDSIDVLIFFRVINLISAAAPPASKIILTKRDRIGSSKSVNDVALPAVFVGAASVLLVTVPGMINILYPGVSHLDLSVANLLMALTPMLIMLSATYGAAYSLIEKKYHQILISSIVGFCVAVVFLFVTTVGKIQVGGEMLFYVELSVFFTYFIFRWLR